MMIKPKPLTRFARGSRASHGFTMVEVAIAMGVTALFGLAVFATNQHLLIALKAQKETTAATMAMQWRMETFRATAFSDIADKNYVKDNILKVRTATDGGGTTIDPFAALGSVTEQLTVNQYPVPSPSPTPTVLSWDKQHNGGQTISTNNNLAAQVASGTVTMLKVDILETWISANGRQRQRQLSSIFTVGNIGQ